MAAAVVAAVATAACSRSNPDFDAVAISTATSTAGDDGATIRTTSASGVDDGPTTGASGDDASVTATDPMTTVADTGDPSTTTGVNPPEPFVLDPCCRAQDGPGCPNDQVQTCTCAFDPFCCETQWDGVCVSGAQAQCGLMCPGNCCALGSEPGCNDEDLANQVCATTPGCCDSGWGKGCADVAATLGQCTSATNCCEAGPGSTPYCDNAETVVCTCTIDAYCCEVDWDAACVQTAISQCNLGNCPVTPGPCCGTSAVPGCNDAAVEKPICIADPSCCNSTWNEQCLEAAIAAGACGSNNSCCDVSSEAGCDQEDVMQCVCVDLGDTYCCSSAWDALCVTQAEIDCAFPCN